MNDKQAMKALQILLGITNSKDPSKRSNRKSMKEALEETTKKPVAKKKLTKKKKPVEEEEELEDLNVPKLSAKAMKALRL